MQIGRRPEDIRRPVLLAAAAAQVAAATERGDNCAEIWKSKTHPPFFYANVFHVLIVTEEVAFFFILPFFSYFFFLISPCPTAKRTECRRLCDRRRDRFDRKNVFLGTFFFDLIRIRSSGVVDLEKIRTKYVSTKLNRFQTFELKRLYFFKHKK